MSNKQYMNKINEIELNEINSSIEYAISEYFPSYVHLSSCYEQEINVHTNEVQYFIPFFDVIECEVSKDDYELITDKLDDLIIRADSYEIYPTYDVSGYDYWTVDMQEHTTIDITINILDSITNHEMFIRDLYTMLDGIRTIILSNGHDDVKIYGKC